MLGNRHYIVSERLNDYPGGAHMRLTFLICLVAALLASPLMAQTTTIYSSLGPEDSFLASSWLVGTFSYIKSDGSIDSSEQNIAVQFTPSEDYLFESASFAFQAGYTYPPYAATAETFSIRLTENLDDVDSALELFSVQVLKDGVYTIYSINHPPLKAGITYYLEVSNHNNPEYTAGQYTGGGMFCNNQSIEDPYLFGTPGPPFYDGSSFPSSTPAFRVEGSPQSPRQLVALLLGDVGGLFDDGTLTQNQAKGLADKLAAAIISLDSGNTRSACNQLGAFVNQVRAFIGARKLSRQAGQSLIDEAAAIRIQIGC